ncbi:hypothetical protein CDAR_254351 [Caerostris darwini]|uniref:Uncharacterized protein n=1 Tax=Caerostris darwini TaxID=1538125 RepID=A0AAV4UB17_9ARAC|nr:hypothetical protein CDAR_368881 [Caerostris darwini]GIY55001.1 hypothetical protein CDAR_254351 [Caerostris darwini]
MDLPTELLKINSESSFYSSPPSPNHPRLPPQAENEKETFKRTRTAKRREEENLWAHHELMPNPLFSPHLASYLIQSLISFLMKFESSTLFEPSSFDPGNLS